MVRRPGRSPAISLAFLFISLPLAQPAVSAECRYDDAGFTAGAVLCQAGLRMQCQSVDDDGPQWVSLNQSCSTGAPSVSETGGDVERDDPAPAIVEDSTAALESTTTEPVESAEVGITVHWAEYGRDGLNCDAVAEVRAHCAERTGCSLDVVPENLCGDSNPERPNLLTVFWSCGDLLRNPAYAQDGTRLELDCS